MEFYGAIWCPLKPYEALWSSIKPYEKPCGALWSSVEFYEALWSPMEPYEALWTPMKAYGAQWSPMESYGALQSRMVAYGVLWRPMKPYEALWSPLELHQTSWSSLIPFQPTRKCLVMQRAWEWGGTCNSSMSEAFVAHAFAVAEIHIFHKTSSWVFVKNRHFAKDSMRVFRIFTKCRKYICEHLLKMRSWKKTTATLSQKTLRRKRLTRVFFRKTT